MTARPIVERRRRELGCLHRPRRRPRGRPPGPIALVWTTADELADHDPHAFVERLASRFPGLRVLLDEHRVDNLGEVLPHVFFGDLTRYVVRNVVAGNRDEVQSLLDELEVAIGSGDEYVENLVAVSFLENLPRPDEEGAEVRSRLGRRLRAELAEMER